MNNTYGSDTRGDKPSGLFFFNSSYSTLEFDTAVREGGKKGGGRKREREKLASSTRARRIKTRHACVLSYDIGNIIDLVIVSEKEKRKRNIFHVCVCAPS